MSRLLFNLTTIAAGVGGAWIAVSANASGVVVGFAALGGCTAGALAWILGEALAA